MPAPRRPTPAHRITGHETDYTVAAAEEALAILLHIAQHPGLGVTDLAVQSGNTKARTFRLLFTLEKCGFVQKDVEHSTYRLGHKSLYLGVAAQEQTSLVRIARRYLREIGHLCNENVQVRIRDGLETLCVCRRESNHALRVDSEVSSRRPLHAGASGKLLLAYAPTEIQAAVLDASLPRFTAHTPTQREQLIQEIVQIKKTGYSVSVGEFAQGAVAVAAPIRDANGTVVAALSIAGPETRLGGDQLNTLIELVTSQAAAFSYDMGHQPVQIL